MTIIRKCRAGENDVCFFKDSGICQSKQIYAFPEDCEMSGSLEEIDYPKDYRGL